MKKKRQRNLNQHKVDFLAIANFDWTSAIIAVDDRIHYGEERFTAFGLVNNRLHVCVYTQRKAVRRIISLRKAN